MPSDAAVSESARTRCPGRMKYARPTSVAPNHHAGPSCQNRARGEHDDAGDAAQDVRPCRPRRDSGPAASASPELLTRSHHRQRDEHEEQARHGFDRNHELRRIARLVLHAEVHDLRRRLIADVDHAAGALALPLDQLSAAEREHQQQRRTPSRGCHLLRRGQTADRDAEKTTRAAPCS